MRKTINSQVCLEALRRLNASYPESYFSASAIAQSLVNSTGAGWASPARKVPSLLEQYLISRTIERVEIVTKADVSERTCTPNNVGYRMAPKSPDPDKPLDQDGTGDYTHIAS